MQNDKCYTGSLWIWMTPSGDYSLHIAPAATRATIYKTTMNKYIPNSLAILMAIAIAVWRYDTRCIA
jgi:hypothetical protein